MSDYWDRPTAIEEYNVFAGEMAHPADRVENLREFHDPYMIDLQPHRDAVHSARIQREAEATKRRHERMRARYEEHGEITKMVSVA